MSAAPGPVRKGRGASPTRPTIPEGSPFLLLGDGGERPFHATTLEKELRALWKAPSGSNAFYRAALANVIVPLGPDADADAAVLSEVARLHPARVFLIQRRPAERGPAVPPADRLLARATALCHLRHGGAGFICSEQILVEWTEASAALLPSAVASMLIGDLPVVLLSRVPGPQPAWSEALAARADLVVADSGRETTPEAIAASWDRTGRHGGPMRDLAWTRLEPWRAIVAETFDAPQAAPALASLRDVTIVHGGATPPSGGWLLAGWLASRLGWTLKRRQGEQFRFDRPGGTVDLDFARDDDESEPVLRAVHLRAAGERPLDVRLTHRPSAPTADYEQITPRPMQRAIPFPERNLAATIVGAIQRREPNPAFQGAARIACAMIAA